MIRIPVILGPTAVGKSELTLALARELGGELISCDSRQVYRGMSVGTAKPTADEQQRVPHHLIDIVDPAVEFSAGEWARLAEESIQEVLSRGKRPLICGGTFFYFQVLSEGLSHSFPADMSFRRDMIALEESESGTLHKRLAVVNPEAASRIHAHDIYRIIRSLQNHRDRERHPLEGSTEGVDLYQFVPIVLERDRSLLYDRINRRVDAMLQQGLYDEFTSLLEKGYTVDTPGLKCVGYREFFNYIDAQCSFEESVAKIKQNSRKFAKRQLTWLRNKIHSELKINMDTIDIENSISTIVAVLGSGEV